MPEPTCPCPTECENDLTELKEKLKVKEDEVIIQTKKANEVTLEIYNLRDTYFRIMRISLRELERDYEKAIRDMIAFTRAYRESIKRLRARERVEDDKRIALWEQVKELKNQIAQKDVICICIPQSN